tara:strand:+ start:215 stop:514 length:300 start_codon:yes stop_codon:yes gene_type:complete
MVLIVSEKEGPNGLLLVITDKDILGKRFTEGKIQLDLTSNFYKGEEKEKEEVKEELEKARDIHLTGKEAVALGVELDLINNENILWVQGIPHAESVIGE